MKLEKPKIDFYKRLCSKVLQGNKQNVYNEEYYQLVTELLEWNPELYTAWNYRKELITHYLFGKIEEGGVDDEDAAKHRILSEELQFVLAKLKRSPKSYWIWNHRMWCLKLDKLSDWKMELKLIETFMMADSRNYHVWSYRRFIISCLKGDPNVKESNDLIDFSEFEFTTKMINKDISNYSAWHNRTNLIQNLFQKAPQLTAAEVNNKSLFEYLQIFNERNITGFLQKELSLVKTAVYTDPDDSSVWFYLKWLISDFFIKKVADNSALSSIIVSLMNDVKELNEVEEDDNGVENKWCLISIAYLQQQLAKVDATLVNLEEFVECLRKLQRLDPMRIERYKKFKIVL